MAKNKSLNDFTQAFTEFKFPSLDYNTVFALQRKNIEAFSAANQAFAEGAQAIVRRQAEIMQASIEEMLSATKDLMTTGNNPEKSLSRNAEVAKSFFESNMANAKEISEMAAKSNSEAFAVLNKRFAEAIDEMAKAAQAA